MSSSQVPLPPSAQHMRRKVVATLMSGIGQFIFPILPHELIRPVRCCPSSNTCAMMNNGVVGCCPVGQNCVGSVAANQITTVTVPAAAVHPGAVTAVVAGGGVYVNGPVAPTTRTIVQGPFCSTLYM